MATTAVSNGLNHPSEAEADRLSAATVCHEDDGAVYVCDKAIQTTRRPHLIFRPESQTQAVSSTMTSNLHSPQTFIQHGRLPETSPNSENAARALSSLFHHFPPAYQHHSPYTARPAPSPSWGRPPPPRYSYPPPSQHAQNPAPEYHSSWQRRQYSDVATTPYVTRASSGSFESSSSSYTYPSPRENPATHPPHPQAPPASMYYSRSHYSNNIYPPAYSFSSTNMDGSSPPYSQPKRLHPDHMDPDDHNGNHHHHHLVTPTPKKMKPTPSLQPVEDYSRKSKSLGLLCEKFCKQDWSDGIGIDEAAKALGVERRRIYDIINILESLEIVQRKCKNRYHWLGFGQLPQILAEIQNEGIRSVGLADEARRLGIIAMDEEIVSVPDVGPAKKSLGRLSRQYLQLFLVGNEVMSLTEASDRINGKAEEPCDIDDPMERKAALTKGQKTKIRRLYDIANVLASIGLVQKADGERRTRPTFTWIYHWSPWQIRGLLKSCGTPPVQSTPQVEERPTVVSESSPHETRKNVLALIHEHGAREPSSQGLAPQNPGTMAATSSSRL